MRHAVLLNHGRCLLVNDEHGAKSTCSPRDALACAAVPCWALCGGWSPQSLSLSLRNPGISPRAQHVVHHHSFFASLHFYRLIPLIFYSLSYLSSYVTLTGTFHCGFFFHLPAFTWSTCSVWIIKLFFPMQVGACSIISSYIIFFSFFLLFFSKSAKCCLRYTLKLINTSTDTFKLLSD